MDPDKASEDLEALESLIADTFPGHIVEQHLGTCAVAKQVPHLPPAAKRQVPKAKKSNPPTCKLRWKPSPIPEGSGNFDPQTPSQSQEGSDTEPSSDNSASPTNVAKKKARPTFPPPLPALPPKRQHFIAQGLGGACPPQPPKNPPPVAAYAREASSAVTHAVTLVENYDAQSTEETVRAVTYAENACENHQ